MSIIGDSECMCGACVLSDQYVDELFCFYKKVECPKCNGEMYLGVLDDQKFLESVYAEEQHTVYCVFCKSAFMLSFDLSFFEIKLDCDEET